MNDFCYFLHGLFLSSFCFTHSFFCNLFSVPRIFSYMLSSSPPLSDSYFSDNDYSDDSFSSFTDSLDPTLRSMIPSMIPSMIRSNRKISSSFLHLGDASSTVSNTLSHTALTSMRLNESNAMASGRIKDRRDRATVEQVIDPRTRIMLAKLVQNEVLTTLHGCISTGKEAHVYFARGYAKERTESRENWKENEIDLAIKIYNTSILVFKDRDRYVSGEHRFQSYCKSNPRKMVKLWAEKECRNLKRLDNAGIPCPKVIALKNHILVMTFIGDNGWPAPRLKDAILSHLDAVSAYKQVLNLVKKMYHICNLVHADLSEYNMLWYNSVLYMIDVSQSVEKDHPHAEEFLDEDVAHVLLFFSRLGVNVHSKDEALQIIKENLDTSAIYHDLETPIPAAPIEMKSDAARLEDLIPASLWNMLPKLENQVQVAMKNDVKENTNQKIRRMYLPKNRPSDDDSVESSGEDVSEDDEDDFLDALDDRSDDDSIEPTAIEKKAGLSREDIKKLRKDNKKQVKAENKERRRTKVPKKEKKKKEKRNARGKR